MGIENGCSDVPCRAVSRLGPPVFKDGQDGAQAVRLSTRAMIDGPARIDVAMRTVPKAHISNDSYMMQVA